MKCFVLVWMTALLLSGCEWGNTPVSDAANPCVRLSQKAHYCLLAPDTAPALSVTQNLQIDGKIDEKNRQFIFLAVLEADQSTTTLVLLNPIGQTWLTVRQDMQGVSTQATTPLPREFDPKIVLALVQLALWPEHKLQESLHAAPSSCAHLEVDPSNRTLWCDGVRILEIVYPDVKQPYTYDMKWFASPLEAPFQLHAMTVLE